MSQSWTRRRVVLLMTLLALGASNVASGVELGGRIRWLRDYAQAHRQRVDNGRPMLVFITMDSCPHCHRMLATTYQDQQVVDDISKAYVPTYINGTEQQDLAQRFGVRLYPTTFVVGPNNQVLDRMEGYVSADQMRARLDAASRRIAALPASTDPAPPTATR